MKTNLYLLLFLLISSHVSAQFELKGRVTGYSGETAVTVNIPVVHGFYTENSISIPVAANGTFSITMPVTSQKFVSLIFQRRFFTLLLTPGKDLNITLNGKDSSITLLSGKALAENKLLRQIDPDKQPFFFSGAEADSLKALPLAALKSRVIEPFLAQQREKNASILASGLSSADKKLVAAETRYRGYNYLNDFARTQLSDKETVQDFVIHVFDQTVIEPEVFPAGPQYYTFADNYLRYLETKAFVKIKKENIKPSEPIPYYHISLDSANVLVKKYGKPYWRWIGSLHNFPPAVTENYTYQQIVNQYNSRDLSQARSLADAFRQRFPASGFNPRIGEMMDTLNRMLAQQAGNKDIVVVKAYDKVKSIYEVIKGLEGKVVYLDIWGTWCGPCKEEIKYLPQLKAAFKNKDVAFVYLDMDTDDRDALWKEFIQVNEMTGVHLRKTRETISPFWKELLAHQPDKAEYYPQYFLFDKQGKLVVSKALQPSRQEALYQQINNILEGKTK
jgi:thiol-disulfide isomerase/thioredoxin